MKKYLAAAKSAPKYKILMESFQELIIFFDSDYMITECNDIAIKELGYGEDIYQIPIYDIFQNVFIYEDNQYSINPLYQNKPKETTVYRKNKTCFPVELKVTISNKKKEYIGLCTAVNIAEKKDFQRELNHLKSELKNFDQMSNELVANITHELRTPVNGIMGFSNNLLEMDLNPKQYEAVSIIKRCCINMNRLINELLDFAKILNNKLTIEQREFSFRNLIQQIINLNIVNINEKGLKLLLDISYDIPDRIIGDELRLSQILNNLFSNAIKFTSIGHIGLKVIKTSQSDKEIELFFMMFDTGIGISREEKDKLFKSFSQVDSSITRRFGGTGLGLAITKKLVEAMNGSISVDSEKNKGSTFSFSIHLGIPQVVSKDTIEPYVNLIEKYSTHNTGYSVNYEDASDTDYVNMLMKEAITPGFEYKSGMETMREAMAFMNDLLDKLAICIEMENWQKAEEYADNMRRLLPADHTNNAKNFFKLILAVRKENHDLSLALLNEIKDNLYKEK